jgi:DNA polymerase-4
MDDRDVQPYRETKSVGAEDTFPYDLKELAEMYDELDRIGRIVHDRLQRHGLKGRTVTLKIKYHDFKQVTRSQSFPAVTGDLGIIIDTAKKLLEATDLEQKRVRLLGISISNFSTIKMMMDGRSDQLAIGF